MSQQKVLYLQKKQGDWAVHDRQKPKPTAAQIFVRVEAAALNPVDWKIQKYGAFLTEFPAIVGEDGAGIVEEIGADVTTFAKGDRVLFPGSIGSYDSATFQQYAVLNPDFVAKIPSNLPIEEAATIPLGIATAATGLYVSKTAARGGAGLVAPWDGGRGQYVGHPIVVIGGSSSVGLYAIQLAKLNGFSPIITTASPSNETLVKSVGATHLVSRDSPLVAAVREITSLPITVVYDAISLADTQQAGWELLADDGTLVTTQTPVVKPEAGEKKHVSHTLAILTLPEQKSVGLGLYKAITELLEEGAIVPNPVEILPGGLAGIPAGLKLLEDNKVSGKKLVAKPHETS